MAGASSNVVGGPPLGLTCPRCESAMPKDAAFCPGCGRSMRAIPPEERLAACVAYLPLVPGAVLLSLRRYRASRFVRFHAWQSILLWGIFLTVTLIALLFSNVAAAMYLLLFGILASLAMFFLWVVLTLKAWQGERFELPLLGVIAGRMD